MLSLINKIITKNISLAIFKATTGILLYRKYIFIYL